MAPGWFESRIKSKVRRLRQTAPQGSTAAPSSPSPSPTPSRPASEPATRTTSQPTPSPPTSTDSKTSSLPSLQEQLWNQAYDELKASEPKLVEAYEGILSARLHRNDSSPIASEPTENEIGKTQETRCRHMQQLVQEGLDRTQKAASIKRGIDEGLQAVQAVRGVVDKAVHAAPEAAVAWVGVCLGLEILSNPVTEARDNRKGIAYVLSRMEWYWNLVSLLLDENKAEQSSAALRVQLEKHVVQLYEKLLSYQMKSVCLYHRNWAAVIGRDMVKIDDWAGQLSEIQEAEAAVQRDMEQYNNEESKMQLRKLTDAASAIEMNLQDIHSAIQDQTRQQERRHQDDGDKQCLKDLRETDPRDDKTRIQDTKGGLLRDSYRWILDNDDFQRWRDDPQSQLLWIKGDPGKGKTMLLCGIIDELEKEPGTCLSYFFCQATEAQLSNATAVLRGLIYLLVDQQPSLISHVRKKHDHAGKQLFEDGNAWEALSKILAAMLNDPSLDGAILIVDALDECKTNRYQLLDFITKPSRVKWIVSSRNWQDIEEKLDNTKQNVRLHLELNKDSVSKAVDTYIGYKVEELAGLKNYNTETRNAVQRHLVDNADGTFLWVALVCKELADSKVVRQRHTLSKLKLFPLGLDPLYERMMEQISDSNDANICKEILAIASVVYRPITLEELKVLVKSLEEDDYNDLPQIIRSCGSFLTLREGVIYFVHQSAKDFLLNKASDQVLPSGAAHQHYGIFSRSLEALSETLERDIYKLGVPGFPIDQVSPPDPDPLASIRYSCVFWVGHLDNSESQAKMSDKVLQDAGIVHDFLQKKYLYWLESLSLLRSMSEGVMAVQKLEALVNTKEARQLTELLRDARRFVLSHKQAIEIAPIQAYVSALVFSPTRSLIRELFEKEEPNWIMLKPTVVSDWNACLQTLEGHGNLVESVAFSADGRWLASGSYNNTVKVWDAATGACVQTLEGHGAWVTSAAFAADGQRLASGSYDKTVKVWDAATGTCVQTLKGHGDSVNSVAFSADGQWLASGSGDKMIKMWDAATGACVQTLESHGGSVTAVAFAADGQRLASSSLDHTVKVWDAATGACVQTLESYRGGWVNSVAFSADSERLASGMRDNVVQVWDAATGACVQTLEGHSDSVNSVAFSADGQWLASGSGDKMMKVWDAATGACVQTLEGHSGSVNSVAFSADSQRLASGSSDYTVKVWDATTGACMKALEGHSGSVCSVALSANGQRLASGSIDHTVKVWDAATGACVQTLKGHGGSVYSVALSADGQRLASGSCDDIVEVWDAATGAYVQTLKGHGDSVNSVAFSADGQRLASGSYDKTIKVWDTATGACVQTLEIDRVITHLSFDPTTSSLLSTDIGLLNLDLTTLPSAIDTQSTEVVSRDTSHSGYGISSDGVWIVKDEKGMLWLPAEYRASASTVVGSTVAIGCLSGRVLMMKFS
ncbi:Vegetative incompatibility protein HET-E-1 [Fusarium keratoplasticum]|uniref:Vegetative incompatibility protein HET-E-1 n=1 Tax=Fusarium keratoplasticum TaxID=1328300 RepID=A0ACC0QUB6_9HYPO|nr:Vegetative incompatibility protein HET-E-1 [Fusarium keratoplasticum]KAI8668591.1 Vegetative incompatibility protein HET-E-1 [Fusarium keratoplasticum]